MLPLPGPWWRSKRPGHGVGGGAEGPGGRGPRCRCLGLGGGRSGRVGAGVGGGAEGPEAAVRVWAARA